MSTAAIADLIEVELPSGAPFEVLNDDEAEYIEKLVDEYLSVFEFTHVADIADLDQLVYLELHLYRWARWSSRTCDYAGGKIDPHDLQRRIKDFQGERRQLKRNMGVDAITREKAKGEGSLPHFFAQLRERAKIFGVHRETQLDRALELTNQLIGIVTVWKNCIDDDERRQLHHTTEDVINWILEVYMPEYMEIDAHFREHEQRTWIRDQ